MTTFLLQAFSFLVCISIFQTTVRAAGTNPPPRLTVELRDGSRVVGTSVANNLKFHSALLGEIKLGVKDVRSVECASTNAAKLTTANGDTLTVSFVDSALAVMTSFGKVELAAAAIRRCTVSAADRKGAHRAGLVALWSGEGDGRDVVGNNDAQLTDITFVEGKAGRAFSFDGMRSSARIPADAVLNVGQGEGMTISAWIDPSETSMVRPILEWNNGNNYGVHFHISVPSFGRGGSGCLYANFVDAKGRDHVLVSNRGIISANGFQHVAVTYDKTSGLGSLYLNGAVVAQENLGAFTPQTAYDLYFGTRASDGAQSSRWAGAMDEISLYNRALSPEEIREDSEAGKSN